MSAASATATQDTVGPVSSYTYTEPKMIGEFYYFDNHCAVIGAALEGDGHPVVVFHFGTHTGAVHISATGEVRPYNDHGFDTLLVSEPIDSGHFSTNMYASSGQADYARRVLTLLLPHLSRLEYCDPYDMARSVIPMLTDRAERHAWCIRDDEDDSVVHACIKEYSDSAFTDVVVDHDDTEYARYLKNLDEDQDDAFTPRGEQHFKMHRVPETDIPPHVEIVGCHWPRRLKPDPESPDWDTTPLAATHPNT